MFEKMPAEQISYIFENTEDAVCLVSSGGVLLESNPAAEKLYKQNIKYLRILGNCGAITDVNISCQKYGESIVPQTILFRATANNSESKGSKERLLYFDVLRVWN